MARSRRLEVVIAGDSRQLEGTFNKVRGEVTKTESAFGKLKKFAGPALLGGAVAGVAIFKDALSGLRAEAEATRSVEAVLQSMGRTEINTESITKFASELQANSDFVEEEIIQAAGVMASFGNVADKDLNRANQAAAELAARFEMDLGSATTMLGKALNDPIAGLTSLGRAGVQFTDQQKDQIRAMVEAGDIAGAQGIVYDELAKQTTGAAAAQQDSFEKLQDVVGETAESILSKAMPAIESLVGWITKSVEAFDRMPPSTEKVVGGIGAVTAALWVLHAHPIVATISLIIGSLIYLEDRFGTVTKAVDIMSGAWDRWKRIGFDAIQMTINNFATMADFILGAAVRAFGWIPGIGDKLRNAQSQLNAFRDSANTALGGIRNREVTVRILEQRISTENRRDAATAGRFAEGGIRESHVAQIAKAGEWRVWAEPETGGEAYIPLARSKRAQSLPIWEETGRRLGVEGFANGGVVPAMATRSSAPVVHNHYNVTVQGSVITERDLETKLHRIAQQRARSGGR